MEAQVNQAVLFTKPLPHVDTALTPEELAERARIFFEEAGCRVVYRTGVTGTGLKERDAIREHYQMYSRAACASSSGALALTEEGKDRFAAMFGRDWGREADKVLTSPMLQQAKGISSHELYLLWNEEFSAGRTCRVQEGIMIARLPSLDCYCVNAFYPAMEENFYRPETEMAYFVVEFHPGQVSWKQFRKGILGATDASRADPESFRGQLYVSHPVEFPGRDNFVHGSAGPLEGLVERTIHEPAFEMVSNPVGRYLAGRGISLEQFRAWKAGRSVAQLGALFDATEEKDTADVLELLDAVSFA